MRSMRSLYCEQPLFGLVFGPGYSVIAAVLSLLFFLDSASLRFDAFDTLGFLFVLAHDTLFSPLMLPWCCWLFDTCGV